MGGARDSRAHHSRGTEGSNPAPSSGESATNRPGGERHQVRIRVHAAGVNFVDSLMVGGTYQVKPQFPFTPGLEAAGEIVETPAAPKPPKPTRYAPSTPRHPKAWLGA